MGSLYNETKPADIGFVDQVAALIPTEPPTVSESTESWTCAWSPDGSLFAWSYGNRSVKIVPWSMITARSNIFGADDFAQRRRSSVYKSIDTNPGKKQSKLQQPLRNFVTIHCGHPVHSVAFGSGHATYGVTTSNVRALRQVEDIILATGLSNGRIRTWDVYTGSILWELMDHRELVGQLQFSPTGSLVLASASKDGTVKLWDMKDDGNMYKTLRACQGSSFWAKACSWSPNGEYLAVVGTHKTAVIFETDRNTIYRKLVGHYHDVLDCDFSPDGALLVTCSYDTRAIVWDAETGDQVRIFCHLFPPPHPMLAGGFNSAFVRSVSYSRDGMHVVTICDDGLLRFWDLENENLPVKLARIMEGTSAVSTVYKPTGNVISVNNSEREVQFYECPMTVNSLKNLCRIIIRSRVAYKRVDKLQLPFRQREFLKYRFEL